MVIPSKTIQSSAQEGVGKLGGGGRGGGVEGRGGGKKEIRLLSTSNVSPAELHSHRAVQA